MLRIPSLLAVFLVSWVGLGPVAHAQVVVQDASAVEPIERPPQAERPVALQLADANAQAETGSIVLGVGLTAHILGAVGSVFGALAAFATLFGSTDSGTAAAALLLSGQVLFWGGLVTTIVGAGLLGGANSRRRRAGGAALPPFSPFVTPLADGLGVGWVGRF